MLCRIPDTDTLAAVADSPETLEQIGFTGLVIPDETAQDLEPLMQRGFSTIHERNVDSALDLSTFTANVSPSAEVLWNKLEGSPEVSEGVDISLPDRGHEATTLIQMSAPATPIAPVNSSLLYSTRLREQRELLRSMVFWRKRYEVAQHAPKLVHAGEDGLLIFTVDFWLVAINQNPEEASIDLGTHGSMWLMLGTHRDVHLHGSMLILPPYTGAVIANELAR